MHNTRAYKGWVQDRLHTKHLEGFPVSGRDGLRPGLSVQLHVRLGRVPFSHTYNPTQMPLPHALPSNIYNDWFSTIIGNVAPDPMCRAKKGSNSSWVIDNCSVRSIAHHRHAAPGAPRCPGPGVWHGSWWSGPPSPAPFATRCTGQLPATTRPHFWDSCPLIAAHLQRAPLQALHAQKGAS